MNLKGLKISKKMCKIILEIGVNNLTFNMLKGLDEFKKYSWSGFQKKELDCLIKAFGVLENNSILENISDNQLFIFNYSTDVTEMDIATVLKNEKNENVIIDIEFKSSEEAETKLDMQILKRIQEHIPQLFLKTKYIIIGMTENGFYRAVYNDGIENANIYNVEELHNLFLTLNDNEYVENVLTQANDLAGIHNLYNSMETGEFRYYEETKRTSEYINKRIEEGNKAIIVFADAGTGKSVIAFKLFFENPNTRLLIMNEKFYRALGLTKYFSIGRCFFGSDTFLAQDLSDKIVIIDEAQRLNKELILEIINASKVSILFGDCGQSFLDGDLSLDESEFVEYLRTNGVYVTSKKIKRSKRYNDSVEEALKYLSNKSLEVKEKISLEDYSIKIFYDASDFLKEYHLCKGSKKMYTTFDYRNVKELTIGEEKFIMSEREFSIFSICSGYENYIGHTLHAISFDVDNNFVYLPNVIIGNRRKKDVLTKEGLDLKNEEAVTKFLNELNILFTRGKKSLNIYTSDFKVYLFLNKKLKDIIQK